MVEIRNTSDPDNAGRDHHPIAYSMWMAGGGIKGGQVVARRTTWASTSPKTRFTCTIWQANHDAVPWLRSYPAHLPAYGTGFRLTDVAGNVVKKMLVWRGALPHIHRSTRWCKVLEPESLRNDKYAFQ